MKLIWKGTRVSAGRQDWQYPGGYRIRLGAIVFTALDKWLLVSTAMPQEEGIRSEKLQRFSPGSELTGKMQNRLSQNFREITSVLGACPRWYMNFAMLTVKKVAFFLFVFFFISPFLHLPPPPLLPFFCWVWHIYLCGKYLGTKLIVGGEISWDKVHWYVVFMV